MKVCFVSLSLYPCLANDFSSGSIGGAEVQQAMIARGLAKKGLDVSVISEDLGQEEACIIDGVTIYKAYKPGAGLPVLRFVYPKIVRIYQALLKADADVYYVRNASFLTALVSLFCKLKKKKWLYAGAHDTDFIPGSELINNVRDRYLYRKGLRSAPSVVVQTQMQQHLLQQHYQKSARIFYNFSDQPVELVQENTNILWVSTIRRWKRPELFLQLAKALPDFPFIMIGGADSSDAEFYQQIEKEAANIPNLKFLGFLPLQETEAYFSQARIFINTSIKEGFPNTFLQAWRRGIPTVSFFDPDDVISTHHLGKKVQDLGAMVAEVKRLYPQTEQGAESISEYYKRAHSDQLINEYIKLFERL